MRSANLRKIKERRKRTRKKIQRLLLFVIFVFSMCKNIEIMLANNNSVEAMSSDVKVVYGTQTVLEEAKLLEEIKTHFLNKEQEQENIQNASVQQDFLTLLLQFEEKATLPLLEEEAYTQLFSIQNENMIVKEERMEQLYMRNYALNYVSERQQMGKETDRQSFYGLIGSVYEEDDFSNYYNLINQFYIVDASTRAVKSLFDGMELLQTDMTVEKNLDEPQILIYHTHSLEAFSNSKEGVEEDTIVGVGNYLTSLLTEKYGYQVLHDKTAYDINAYGYGDRDNAYQRATKGLERILEAYPSIEIIIDLHRDSREMTIAHVGDKEVAQIMLFNGLCRNVYGPYLSYTNAYLSENLAFSLQMRLMGESLYPGVMRRVYLKSDQYNMHYRPHSLLVEVGTEQNTIQQAKNAMDIFADILNEVLTLK